MNTAICAGICPMFTLTMSDHDEVKLAIFRGDDQPPFRYAFRASVREAAAFRRELASIRPSGKRQFAKPCDAGYENDELFLHGVSNFEIRWRDGVRDDRLFACWSDNPVNLTTKRALTVLRIEWANGLRISARRARALYKCYAEPTPDWC